MQIKIRERLEVLRGIGGTRFAKWMLSLWAFFSSYDLALSQFVPDSIAKSFPKGWQVAIVTGDLLTWQQWVMLLLVVLVGVFAEFAFRRGRNVEPTGAQSVDKLAPQSIGVSSGTQMPQLRLDMPGANMFSPSAPHMHDTHTGFAVAARVWNTGAPSAALGWRLAVDTPGHPRVSAECVGIPPGGLTLHGDPSYFIPQSSALNEKTGIGPVPGMPLGGTLLFYPKVKRSLITTETRLTLTVTDIHGVETHVSKRIEDWNTSGPGLDTPRFDSQANPPPHEELQAEARRAALDDRALDIGYYKATLRRTGSPDTARLLLAQLWEQGVVIRNHPQTIQHMFTPELEAWIAQTTDWMEDVIVALKPLDAPTAIWFRTLGNVGPSSVAIPNIRLDGDLDRARYVKAFREHDLRLIRLKELLPKHGVGV